MMGSLLAASISKIYTLAQTWSQIKKIQKLQRNPLLFGHTNFFEHNQFQKCKTLNEIQM